ncbi:aminotransferase class I/II-fold pyridoxal phosphate-dependent enzyme [Candidatus Micrarchaeota archaeon]|nr:aminotransferase class I/II-fold pyridoxal phosphate-dependent enzyme [Candidatus Micrarchaeota archaeon]
MIKPSMRSELVSYPIRDIVVEAKRLEKQGIKMAYLNIGDPAPFGFRPPKHVTDAVIEAARQNYSAYAPSEGDPELRKEIAKCEGVGEGDVFVTAGLSEGIDFLFQALVDPGRNILLPLPAYPLYSTKQRLSYGPLDFYGCDENYEPNIDDLRKKISPYTRAILVINPNNPTGKVYSRKTLEKIVDVAGEYKLPIIADDAYEHIILDESDYVNMRKIHKDVPIVSGNSLSKNFIYPGARVGYVAFHGNWGEEIKDAMQRLCNQRLSVNWEMQRGYIAALRGPMDHVKAFNAELRKRRDVLMRRVGEIEGLHVVKPGGAFYAFVKVESNRWKSDWEFARALLKKGVVVVPGSGFGPVGNIYFRMVFLPSVEQLNGAFDKIEEMMKGK